MWDENVAALAPRFRVLRYDTRGHGGSPAPAGPYTMDELGADVLALLDRLELERVAFCGLSIGGMIGMWLAREAPQRLDRLLVCCTPPPFPPRPPWGARVQTPTAPGGGAEGGA